MKAGDGYDDDATDVAEVAVTSRVDVDVRQKLVVGGRRAEHPSSEDHYAHRSAADDSHSSPARPIDFRFSADHTAARSKGKKADIALPGGTPPQNYGTSLAKVVIWDHTVLPATRHK